MSQLYKIRKNTVDPSKINRFLDMNRQQFMGILGVRGEGKSVLIEGLAYQYWKAGYTILDLWGAPNYENYFWCISADGHKTKIPITILAPESLIDPKEQVNNFNATQLTDYPLVRIVRLPNPTAKEHTEQNEQIFNTVRDEIIRCNKERRVLAFNAKAFPDENSMFRILEIIFRGVDKIAYDNFKALEPEDVGVKTRQEMTVRQKNQHKFLFVVREFGELAPARMKGDKSGQSTIIKKAQLKLFRLARHASVSGFIDYQNASDVDSAIRHQIDVWAIKGWTRDLAGEQFQWVFDKIEARRTKILEHYRYSQDGRTLADSVYPPVELLDFRWYYGFNAYKIPKLYPVPLSPTKHKEPTDKWEFITKIPLNHDFSLIKKANASSNKASRADERDLFNIMTELKKKYKWSEVREKISIMQENGEVNSNLQFNAISDNQVSSKYSKLQKKYTN